MQVLLIRFHSISHEFAHQVGPPKLPCQYGCLVAQTIGIHGTPTYVIRADLVAPQVWVFRLAMRHIRSQLSRRDAKGLKT